MTPSVTESAMFAALRTFLLAILPTGVNVSQGQDNRVPEPVGPDYVVMWPTNRTRQATNVDTWAGADPASIDSTMSTKVMVQIDVHGPVGGDNAQVIVTLLRSSYAIETFATGIVPLGCQDPQQMPFLNGENQYENRWVIMAELQVSPTVSTPAEFADTLNITVKVPADLRSIL